ncbi:hypothetical protein ACHAXS_005388 [Conticribra weissflogii]
MSSSSTPSTYRPRPPLLPWPPATWSARWAHQGRLSPTPIPRTPFLLLKAPASTLYEEKFGGDRNMFTVGMYCSRMMARSVRVGCVVDCTALDLEEFEALPPAAAAAAKKGMDKRVRYFHNPSEWDDYDVEYHRLLPPDDSENGENAAEKNHGDDTGRNQPLAPQVIPKFLEIVSTFLQKSRANNNHNNGSNNMTYIAIFDSRGGLGAASYLSACYMCQILRAPVHVALEAVKEGTPLQPLEETEDAKKKKWGLCDWRLMKDLQIRFKGRKEIVVSGGRGSVPSWWWAVEDEDEGDGDDEDDEEETEVDLEEEIHEGDIPKQSAINGEAKESSSKKRKRNKEEETITIPPYDPSNNSTSNNVKRQRGDNHDASLYPILPKEILEPVPTDSPKWTRAMSVLAQLTQIPSSSSNSNSSTTATNLPLRPEIDISSQDGTNKIIVDEIASSIKNNSQSYKATWLSTKGRRGLLLILAEAVYFVEQPQSQSPSQSSAPVTVSVVTNIKFPSPQKNDPPKTQHRTLLDVVLVLDIEKSRQQYRFYALDILAIEGGMVWHKPHEQRWRYLNENVLLPRKKEEGRGAQGRGHDYAKEPIKIRAKEYFPLHKLGFVTKDVCAGVGHEAKGVMIIPMGVYGVGGDAGSCNYRWCLKEGEEGGREGKGNDDIVGREKFLSVVSVVWRRGEEMDESKFLSMLS